jgi:hypothetical protein
MGQVVVEGPPNVALKILFFTNFSVVLFESKLQLLLELVSSVLRLYLNNIDVSARRLSSLALARTGKFLTQNPSQIGVLIHWDNGLEFLKTLFLSEVEFVQLSLLEHNTHTAILAETHISVLLQHSQFVPALELIHTLIVTARNFLFLEQLTDLLVILSFHFESVLPLVLTLKLLCLFRIWIFVSCKENLVV